MTGNTCWFIGVGEQLELDRTTLGTLLQPGCAGVCSHLKAGVGRKYLEGGSLMSIGRRPQLLTPWASPPAHTLASGLRASGPRKSTEEAVVPSGT